MRKRDELSGLDSCINKALPGELVFTLLGRDEDSPAAIREWAQRRVMRGKNKADDPQIVDALKTADQMDRERDEVRGTLQLDTLPKLRTEIDTSDRPTSKNRKKTRARSLAYREPVQAGVREGLVK